MMYIPEIISSKIVYCGTYHTIRMDELKLESGIRSEYFTIERKNAVIGVPITSEGKLVLVEQYRHPVKKYIIDLPGGFIDENETPEIAIKRELIEETGYDAKKISFLCKYYTDPSVMSQEINIFTATDLIRVSNIQPEITSTIFIKEIDPHELKSMICGKYNYQVASSWSYIGILSYLLSQNKNTE